MSNIKEARTELTRRILAGAGKSSTSERQAAFNNCGLGQPLGALTDKIALHASTVNDEDISALITKGVSEDQVFEIAVCAAVGQATRQYETALAALQSATRKH
jgi:hypothetical protein